jgi:hypothetical protein
MGDQLPGQLVYVFVVSIIDAAALSWLTLYLYRRYVRRLMRVVARPGDIPPVLASDNQPPPATPAPPIHFAVFEATKGGKITAGPDRLATGRLGVAYCVGAALHAAVITALIWVPESPTLPAAGWIAQWWMYAWPVLPTLGVLFVLNRRSTFRLVALYLVAGSVLVAAVTLLLQLARGSLNSAPVTNVFWMLVGLAWLVWAPIALLAIVGWRRVRAVMPMVVAVTLLFGFASTFSTELFIRLMDVAAARSVMLDLAGLTSVATARFAPFMLLSLPVGLVAWVLVRRLAGAYARKRFSDLQLLVDCGWVVVTAEVVAVSLASIYGLWAIVAGAAAFAAYRAGVWLWLRDGHGGSGSPDVPKRLLMLRVFGYEARTEALFDRVAQRWRFHGPVQLIAGSDLALRTVDPGDLLTFLNGRLVDNVVQSPGDVTRRLAQLDFERDPDTRYRINEVYCRDDSWRPAFEALLGMSDVVLMDLRSFNQQNSGCIYELKELVRRVATDNIVLVCDRTTDLQLLARVLGHAWHETFSGGATREGGVISLVRMESHSRRELSVLMNRLLGGGAPPRIVAAPDLPPAFA